MSSQIIQTYRRIENALLTVLALAWFGLLGDRGFSATAPATRSPRLAAPGKEGPPR